MSDIEEKWSDTTDDEMNDWSQENSTWVVGDKEPVIKDEYDVKVEVENKEFLIKDEYEIKVEVKDGDVDEGCNPDYDGITVDLPSRTDQGHDKVTTELSLSYFTGAEDHQTAQELLDMINRWNIVRLDQSRGSKKTFCEFWETPAVQNVRKAVQMNFLSADCGADLLGINKKHFTTNNRMAKPTSDFLVIKQDIIEEWGIVKKEEFKKTGKTVTQFWKEAFVRKVLYVVQNKFFSDKVGGQLLGVCLKKVKANRWKLFGKVVFFESPLANLEKSASLLESDNIKVDRVQDMNVDEERNINWWDKIVHLKMKNSLDKIQVSRTWIVFLQFSQLEIRDSKAVFNPHTAGKQQVSDFLQYLELTQSWLYVNHPELCLASIAVYRPDLSLPRSVTQLMTSHPPTLGGAHVNVFMATMSPLSPFHSTWASFCQFCEDYGGDVDPFQAKPVLVRDFLVSKFEGKEMRLEEFKPRNFSRTIKMLEKEPFFRPAFNFYRDNLKRLLSELDWHLQNSWMNGPLEDCKEINLLNTAAVYCDERLITEDPDLKTLVLKLSPNYSYTKVRLNYSEDLFWRRKFTENILKDVRKRSVPLSVAASGLGVTAEMIMFVLKQNSSLWDRNYDRDNPAGVIAVTAYVLLGYGTAQQFWNEQSIVNLLDDVRNRNISLEKLAALTGVSRKEVDERCGGVKEKAEIEAEEKLAAIEQMKRQAEQPLEKRKSQLDIRIEMAEKNVDSLSDYEKMRLNNMKENQKYLVSLDFDKEKGEILALTPRNKPAVQLREKSARVKRRSQVVQLKKVKTEKDCTKNKWNQLQKSRASPQWFGHWVPRSPYLGKKNKALRLAVTDVDLYDVYDEEAICHSNYVPKFELQTQELLEISTTTTYRRSRTLLDSFAEDLKQVGEEEKLVTKPNWSKFEVVQDSMVSSSLLTSLDSCNDFVCFGTKTGGVGVALAGRALTIKPHNRQVTRTLFVGSKNSTGILSAALDGTVRMTDLAQQSVCLEYSWDQSYSDKQGVNWLEQMGVNSFLLDCGDEINQIDIRSKEALQLFEVVKTETVSNLSINPVNNNQLSLCRGNSVQIWDLRKTSEAVVTLPGPSGSLMAGGGWSCEGNFFVTCVEAKPWSRYYENSSSRCVTVVHNGTDFSQTLHWEGPRKTNFVPSSGVTWCPWEESLFLTSMEMMKYGTLMQGVVAVDCTSGEVILELSSALDSSSYLVHCSKSREVVVVGNSNAPGGLAVFGITK